MIHLLFIFSHFLKSYLIVQKNRFQILIYKIEYLIFKKVDFQNTFKVLCLRISSLIVILLVIFRIFLKPKSYIIKMIINHFQHHNNSFFLFPQRFFKILRTLLDFLLFFLTVSNIFLILHSQILSIKVLLIKLQSYNNIIVFYL